MVLRSCLYERRDGSKNRMWGGAGGGGGGIKKRERKDYFHFFIDLILDYWISSKNGLLDMYVTTQSTMRRP